MALARQCTRCDAFYRDYYYDKESKYNGMALMDIDLDDSYVPRRIYDLCPNCKKSLDEWLNYERCEQE